jgi:hypothetical protein
VPSGGGASITDLVFENPDGNSGTIQFLRNGDVLLSMKLDNFRDLDFHYIAPLIFRENDSMSVTCKLDTGTSCTAAVQFSGYAKSPLPAP